MSKKSKIHDLIKNRSYYKRNLKTTNNLVSIFLCVASCMGILFALGTYISIFKIPYIFCLKIQLIGLMFSLLQYLCNKKENLRGFVKYLGLILLSIFVFYTSILPGVGLSIYLAFVLVPFISTLYLYSKLSIVTAIVTYVLMVFSLHINGHYNTYFGIPPKIPTYKIFGELIGYSSAFLFVFITTLSIAASFRRTLEMEFLKQKKIKELKYQLIETFAHIIEWSDKYTGQHIQRTRKYVEVISKKLSEMHLYEDELSPARIQLFVSAAPLHDIGKINIPNNILCKPGKFTPEEYEIMKTHSETGYNIITKDLYRLEDPDYIKIAGQMALFHHEKWDGTGYPHQVKGTDIPLCGRIMAAADVLDALLSKRQYKEAFTLEETFEIFENEKNKQFEPCIVDAVLASRLEILQILSETRQVQLLHVEK